MARFKDIVLNEEEGTVEIGAGLTWAEVYAYLVPKGLNVVGGRVGGVGVGGFTLGGGKHPSILECTHSLLLNVINVISARGRIFLEDQSVWSHNGHSHCVRTRATERICEEGHRGGRRPLVCTQGTHQTVSL